MINYADLSINARIALCLIYAEKMVPKIETLINCCNKAEEYSQGKQQINDILDLAWSHLQDRNRVDWSEMYALCNEGHGCTDDMKYNGHGYFDFVLELNCKDDENSITISNMMIFCFYYAMYHFAKRQNDMHLPEDMEWFDMKESESEAFSQIDKAVNLLLSFGELQKVSELTKNLYKLFPFNQTDPYGHYISKEKVFRR